HAPLPHLGAHRGRDVAGEEALPQPRFLQRLGLPLPRHPDADVHPGVRRRAHHRLGGARLRAAREQQADPPHRRLHRPRAPALRTYRPTYPPRPGLGEGGRGVRANTPDHLLVDIADYVTRDVAFGDEAYATARLCLMDSLGCALLALEHPECTRLLGPVVPGAGLPGGARVPGTAFELDPVQAAFNLGTMIRWLD